MKRYIEKDHILAEIDRRMEELRPTNTHKMQTGEKVDRNVLMWLNALTWVKKLLNTLEVKDVNCDKEIGMYTTKELLRKRNKATNVFRLTQGDIDRIAKHFFELGLKTQKGE